MSKRSLRIIAMIVLTVYGFTGCASYQRPARAAYHPTIPVAQQDVDRKECEAIARERTQYDPVGATASGAAKAGLTLAAVGAATFAVLGAIGSHGRPGRAAAVGAVLGGASGAIAGGATEMNRGHDLYTKEYSVCLRARGYIVE